MMSRLTQTQGKRLCELVHLLRPEWDIPGIEAAVRKAADVATAAEVAAAACALAANTAIRTPGMLHQPGAHWPKGEQYAGPRQSNDVRCPEHPLSFHPCPECVAKRTEPSPEYLAAKAALRSKP